jgi:RNA polymerase sigma-70 factor (ECF subfamily)
MRLGQLEAAPEGITQLLINWRNGDNAALDQLMPLVYEELRRLARGFMRKERRDHTLQTSALINEAYLRLVDQDETNWQNRAHFLAVAAQIMRHILIDHARGYRYEKRGAGAQRVGLDEAMVFSEERAAELVALDEALTSLATVDPRKSRIIELRFFGGLNIDETAEVMELSPTTVQREWRAARAWLRRFIKGENPPENL